MKKIILSFMLLGIILLISGCGYTIEEKRYMKKLESNAEKNAINYISNKYNIRPTVLSTKVEKVDTSGTIPLSPDPTGYVFVTLSYNRKEFEVYISGEEDTIDEGMDNYQYDEILLDTLKYINDRTGLTPYNSLIYYGYKYNKYHNGLIEEYYTYTDLEKIMNNYHFTILLEYIDSSNLEYIKTNELFNDLKKARIILVNFNSREDYDMANTAGYNIWGSTSIFSFNENSLYIESACEIMYGESECYKFN